MDRIILHCDLNYFYANVEMLYHPETRHLPVAVGGSVEKRHGIILAKNSLARSFGIKTGEALWQAKRKCPDLIIYPPDQDKYHKFSRMTKNIFRDFSDKIESFGIDEAWLDITESFQLFGTPYRTAYLIKERIKNELGITASIGVSYSKIFAKLGSDYNKYDAITVIDRKNKPEIVDPLPVGDLLGVGRSTVIKLQTLGINTIGELANSDPELLKRVFGKVGEVLYLYARGLDGSQVDPLLEQRVPKSLGNSTTTPEDMVSKQDVYLVMNSLSQSVASRLKQQNLKGRCLSVYVRTKDLEISSFQTMLSSPTNLHHEIIKESYRLFNKRHQLTKPLRSIGICLSKITSDTAHRQLSFFAEDEKEISDLEITIDQIRDRFGYSIVNYAAIHLNKNLIYFSPKDEHTVFPLGSKV